MKNYFKKNISTLLTGFLAGCFVALAMFYFFKPNTLHKSGLFTPDSRLDSGKYKFIKPILNSGYADEDETLKWFPAERKLKILVQDVISEKPEIKTGIFFMNLNNSGWFSVNATDTFIPASLLKLPMLISYFKLQETEKDLFEQEILYQGKDFNKSMNLGNGTITPGQTYKVKELMSEMIVNSDNNALQLLYKYRADSLRSIFDDMRIPLPSTDGEIAGKDFITTRDISRFLLVLYNASYLTRESSEEALAILSKAKFKDGIVAGVPGNVTVSHKFGERELIDGDKKLKIELHDCGIVYHSKSPYILCIMTRGGDIKSEKLQIQKISRVIYNSVDSFSEVLK